MNMVPKKIFNIVGARRIFIKVALILKVMKCQNDLEPVPVHMDNTINDKMFKVFFDDLEISHPDINPEVGAGTHA